MNNRNILFNREIVTLILVLAVFSLSISLACARTTGSDEETAPSDYGESAIRRFEVVSLISLPFTAIHSYLIFRGVKMIQQREFSPDISDNDYKIIGGMAISFSLFIGFWDWYHTRGEDTSQPKISIRKIRKEQQWKYGMRQTRNLSFKSNFINTKRELDDEVILIHLYQIEF